MKQLSAYNLLVIGLILLAGCIGLYEHDVQQQDGDHHVDPDDGNQHRDRDWGQD